MNVLQPFLHYCRENYHRLCDPLFGPLVSTLTDAASYPVMLPLPEGIYYGDITRFTHTMRRPRFPLATMRAGSIVKLYGGIPLGNGQGEVVSISSPETNVQA